MEMWEVLIPTTYEDTGKPVKTRHHKVFDKKCHEISGGSTILPVAKGYWLDSGMLYQDRVIPVRIICSETQVNEIIDFAIKHYRQLAILAYRISDRVILKRAKNV